MIETKINNMCYHANHVYHCKSNEITLACRLKFYSVKFINNFMTKLSRNIMIFNPN